MEYLNINKILVEDQFGFRNNLATEEAIYRFTDEIIRAVNSKPTVDFVFCGHLNAFYSVNHEILSEFMYCGMIG
jgi:hypothetical protein